MNKIIKFRGWDESTQTYNFNLAVGYHSQNGKGALVDVFEIVDGGADLLSYENSLKIEQFTNQQDAHGVDIYDGDLLAWDGHILRVAFSEDGGWMARKYGTQTVWATWGVWPDCCEIIGNINQNPKMWGDKNE